MSVKTELPWQFLATSRATIDKIGNDMTCIARDLNMAYMLLACTDMCTIFPILLSFYKVHMTWFFTDCGKILIGKQSINIIECVLMGERSPR